MEGPSETLESHKKAQDDKNPQQIKSLELCTLCFVYAEFRVEHKAQKTKGQSTKDKAQRTKHIGQSSKLAGW
jgi:hypothetical protein